MNVQYPSWKGIVVPALLLLLLAAGCASEASRQAFADGAVAPEANGNPASNDEDRAPEFTLQTVEGEPFTLSESDGQVRLIDFWATWCAPCREEVPMFNELQQKYADQGFRIVAISDEEVGVIQEFMDEHDVVYTNLVGTEEVIEAYKVLALPSAYLLDGEGRVVDSFLGPIPRKILVEKIEALLDRGPAT